MVFMKTQNKCEWCERQKSGELLSVTNRRAKHEHRHIQMKIQNAFQSKMNFWGLSVIMGFQHHHPTSPGCRNTIVKTTLEQFSFPDDSIYKIQ